MSAYRFNVPNGNYDVTLKFAEIQNTTIGSRVFNVSIEGNLVLNNFDIYAQAGHDKALDKLFNVNVTDGRLDIDFGQITGCPIINAIYVQRK